MDGWEHARGRKRVEPAVPRVGQLGKPIWGKSNPSGKTLVIYAILNIMKKWQLGSRVDRKITQFGAGCTDDQAEISVLDMFRGGRQFSAISVILLDMPMCCLIYSVNRRTI